MDQKELANRRGKGTNAEEEGKRYLQSLVGKKDAAQKC